MEFFPGTTWKPVDDEVLALVQAAQERGEWLCTNLNEVGLIADPQPADSEYADQLLWTYETMFHKKNRAVIGQREFYQNLVPELQALGQVQIKNLVTLDMGNDRELVQWLHKLVPVTWCPWAWTRDQARGLARQLPESQNVHVRDAKYILPGSGQLSARWYDAADEWLRASGE